MLTRDQIVNKARTERGSGARRGGRLRRARTWAGLSLRGAADALLDERGRKLSYQAIRHYETERSDPDLDVFLDLCSIYDASPLWVLIELGPERWSDLPGWLEQPEEYALQAAVERFAQEVGQAGRAAGVAESVAEYWAAAGRSISEGENPDD